MCTNDDFLQQRSVLAALQGLIFTDFMAALLLYVCIFQFLYAPSNLALFMVIEDRYLAANIIR